MTAEEVLATGVLLVDEPHPDGGLGLRVAGLPSGGIALHSRTAVGEALVVIGPLGTERLTTALDLWRAGLQAGALGPVVVAAEPEGEVRDE